ncbi:hypothetical protein [Wolbachia endosymbiont (group A) of Philonthus cognatus]|uniref:hypothetical protein n=1 Tax=Wolbachia endosymbiont (group A) of Philonthus cognatus TaxID=2954046 RepID=UPI00222F45B6|nr:hypothetical protein [Wolbachia endosymbiont (group A) of Philonthus cognatus]
MLKYNVLMIMKKLDSSVKHWNDTILFSGSQWALLHRSSEKNWQLLTKFIINSDLTVEEKICHKK